MEIGIPALRVISLSWLLAGFNIICSSTFQALGHGVISLFISILRQMVVILPVAFIFSRIAGLQATWLAFPISEVVAMLFTAFCMGKIYRKEIKPMFEAHTNGAEA